MAYDTRPILNERVDAHSSVSNCLLCPAAGSCLASGIARSDVMKLNSVISSQVSISTNKAVFYSGDEMKAIYVVRAGCIKTYTVDHAGHERVRGFHMAGDVIGLDALCSETYLANAVAVTSSQVCRISKKQLQTSLQESPALMQRVMERLSQSLGEALSLAGDYTADQRVAAFLLNMQHRLNPASEGPTKLPMPRADIANYLRLATETVCRVLTRLEHQGLIRTHDRVVHLLKSHALIEIAEPVGLCARPLTLKLAA